MGIHDNSPTLKEITSDRQMFAYISFCWPDVIVNKPKFPPLIIKINYLMKRYPCPFDFCLA